MGIDISSQRNKVRSEKKIEHSIIPYNLTKQHTIMIAKKQKFLV